MKNNEKNGYILLSKEDSLILFWETLFQNFLPYSNKYIRYTKTDISPFYSFFVALSPQEKKKYLNYFKKKGSLKWQHCYYLLFTLLLLV